MAELSEEIKILERCVRLFMRYGVKSVTMDDIARELGMSKKTLYQYFSNKNDLVNKVARLHFEAENEAIHTICTTSANAIDELLNISRWVSTQMKGINPPLMLDLQKYHPDAWAVFQSHKNSDVYQCMLQNIHRGMEEGLYRRDINPEIIARLYIGKMELVVDTELFPPGEFSFQHIHHEFIHYHIRGIASERGLAYLEQIQNQPYAQ